MAVDAGADWGIGMRLTALTDKAEIAEAMHRLERTLGRGADKPLIIISVRSGGGTWGEAVESIWHEHLDLWAYLSTESAGTRYWCCFGIGGRKAHQRPVVEINSPIEGINRRCRGVFARDERGKVHYLHDGGIAGGHPGVGKNAFLDSGLWTGERAEVEWPDGAVRPMFTMGRVDDAALVTTLAGYVHAVARFREMMGSRVVTITRKQRVFLSHSNASDDKQWCDEFVRVLKGWGRDVWYDHSDLMSGILSEQLANEIAARDVFVLALSRNALGSPFVRMEIDRALALWGERERPSIVPIRLEDCEVPLELDHFTRVHGPGDIPLKPTQAAEQVDRMLAAEERTH